MTDDIWVDDDSLIEVSPDEVRESASRALAAAQTLREAAAEVDSALAALNVVPFALGAESSTNQVRQLLLTEAEATEVFASQLAAAADTYETAELLARQQLSGIGSVDRVRLNDLLASNSAAANRDAENLAADIAKGLAPGALAALRPVARQHYGVTFDKKTTATAFPGRVAPRGATDLADRIPHGSDQVRVEEYVFADGTSRYVVSVSGTRDWGLGGTEPFNMTANAQLYTGNDSRSLEAVRVALEDAGVQPSDWVMINSHSQAVMASELVAREPQYDVDALVDWGGPTDGPIPPDVTRFDVRHLDDPVVRLAPDAGPPTGSADSVSVWRDDVPGVQWIPEPGSHGMDTYHDTAKMIDQSSDPRLDIPGLDELRNAEHVVISDYTFTSSERPARDSADAVGGAFRPVGSHHDGLFHIADEQFTQNGLPSDSPGFVFGDTAPHGGATFDLWRGSESGTESASTRKGDNGDRAAPWLT